MKHTICEDPITRKFALIRVPPKFAEGGKPPIPPTVRWLNTREEVVEALPALLKRVQNSRLKPHNWIIA
jgi:hypothetical protein